MAASANPTTDDPSNPSMVRSPRTIVLCFDGTSNEYSSANTNVVKLCSLLKKDNEQQMVYYQAGIGTYVSPGLVAPAYTWCAKVLDEAFAIFLPAHVMEGYKFLMQNYNIGDRVCIFGFSRGAYTARALAGMVHKVGLLSKDNDEQVPFAWKTYTSKDTKDDGTAAGFKQTFCRDVPIDFVGVWDTVASVGIVMGRTLPFVQTNDAIKTFRHALSLDEHRAKFRPSYYVRPVPENLKTRSTLGKIRQMLTDLIVFRTRADVISPSMANGTGKSSASASQSSEPAFETDVKEVWFAGCHSDDGGGNWPDTTVHAVENITLRWMVREIMKADCGVVWEEEAFARLGIPFSIPDSETIRTEDAADAAQPITDQLVAAPVWWLLEILPTQYSYQDEKTGQWVNEWNIHLGRGRYVPRLSPVNLHSSVKQRMDNAQLKYKPRARYGDDKIVYVD